jgi:hypothetical protein
MAEIEHTIIANFLCTNRLDSTKVDLDPYLMQEDFIFRPVRSLTDVKQIHGMNMDRYIERLEVLFSPYREKN